MYIHQLGFTCCVCTYICKELTRVSKYIHTYVRTHVPSTYVRIFEYAMQLAEAKQVYEHVEVVRYVVIKSMSRLV